MAVRFLPQPDRAGAQHREERGELAEVIDLRSKLPAVVDRARSGVEHARSRSERTWSAAGVSVALEPEAGPGTAAEAVSEPVDDARTAHEDGVRLLARKALSSGELARELQQLGHGADEIESVIEEFVSGLYLDDAGMARVLTEKLRERKRASRTQIMVKLRERLLPSESIEAALGELDADEEFELLRSAAFDRAKKMRDLDRVTAERRLLGFLARRGWSGERAVRAAREALDLAASESGGAAARGSRGIIRFQ